MERYAFNNLLSWKKQPDGQRKPLIIEGARQTGKTWLARELGRRAFDECVEINFEDKESLRTLFETDFNLERILKTLRLSTGKEISPGRTLLFFDEIQHARRGLLALKYFFDKAPQYHIIAAGSLLGVIDHQDDSFPVGKVDFLQLHPLCFEEFLTANGKQSHVELLHSRDWTAITAFAGQYTDLLRQYYYTGGMPEAVQTFINTGSYDMVRKIQTQLLTSYELDYSKHPPKEIVKRMEQLWRSIPAQLSKENRKFVYSAIKSSARARDYETAIQWLVDAGMTHKVTRITQAELPLGGFEDYEAFKLYVLDIGLHGAMVGLDARSMLNGNEFFKQYKGALTEQYVLQELCCMPDTRIHYWSPETGKAEVDFVVQQKGLVVPIEVKAEQNLRAKSLQQFINRYAPTTAIRTSLAPYHRGKNILDLPLYAISVLGQEVETPNIPSEP